MTYPYQKFYQSFWQNITREESWNGAPLLYADPIAGSYLSNFFSKANSMNKNFLYPGFTELLYAKDMGSAVGRLYTGETRPLVELGPGDTYDMKTLVFIKGAQEEGLTFSSYTAVGLENVGDAKRAADYMAQQMGIPANQYLCDFRANEDAALGPDNAPLNNGLVISFNTPVWNPPQKKGWDLETTLCTGLSKAAFLGGNSSTLATTSFPPPENPKRLDAIYNHPDCLAAVHRYAHLARDLFDHPESPVILPADFIESFQPVVKFNSRTSSLEMSLDAVRDMELTLRQDQEDRESFDRDETFITVNQSARPPTDILTERIVPNARGKVIYSEEFHKEDPIHFFIADFYQPFGPR